MQILSAIINQVRKLLLAKDFTTSSEAGGWHAGLSYNVFQQKMMPAVISYDQSLRRTFEKWEQVESGSEDANSAPAPKKRKKKKKIQTDLMLARNPKNSYPVFQLLKKSVHFSKSELMNAVDFLNETDAQLKISRQDPKIILERLVLKICKRQEASR